MANSTRTPEKAESELTERSKQVQLDDSRLDSITRNPFPASRKIYAAGSLYPFIRVPMREITQTPTRRHGAGDTSAIPNSPVVVYDTSGAYTDPEIQVDVREGIAPTRRDWIRDRGDTEELPAVSSHYGQLRLADPKLDILRFKRLRKPLRAKAGRSVTQMHYARKGIITPEMEFIAIRENQRQQE